MKRALAIAALAPLLMANAATPRSRLVDRHRTSAEDAGSLFSQYDVLLFVTAGQSNSRGVNNESSVPVTGIHAESDWQWCQSGASNVSELDVMRYGSNCYADAEHPNSGIIDEWRERLPADFGGIMMGVTCGVSGTAIGTWWTTSSQTNWTACSSRIAAAVTDLESNPGNYGLTGTPTILVIGMTWQQGESDSATAEATYDSRLQGLIDDFESVAAAQTGQTSLPQVILEQISTYSQSGAGGSTTPTPPTLAQIDICARESNVHCVGGTYAHAFEQASPFLHKQPPNHRLSGEIMGRRMWGAWSGGDWNADAPRISSVTVGVDQTTATICFDQPITISTPTLQPNNDGGLADATALGARTDGAVANYGCAAHPNGDLGLELTSDGTPPTLSSCAANGSSCVDCTMSAALTVAERPVFRVAWTAGGTAITPAGCQGNGQNAHSNIVASTTGLYAQHDLCELIPDGGVPCVTVRDGGVVPDSGPADSGVTPDAGVDGGVIPFIVKLDESFDWPASTSGANSHAPLRCDGGPCVYCYNREYSAAGECQETPDGGGGNHYVATAQQYQAARLAAGDSTAIAMVADSYPGTAITSWDLSNITSWDDAVSAAAAGGHSGSCVWPTALLVGAGCYQLEGAGTAFSSCSGAIATHLSTVLTSVGALAEVCPDWTTADMEVLFTGGSFQAWGGADNSYNQHLYSGEYIDYQDSAHWFCGHLGQISVGADGLHPDGAGLEQIADILASCMYRHEQGTLTSPMELTAAAWQSSTVLRLTFDLACRDDSTCEDDPPITVDTTNLAAQTTSGDVVTYGVHFYMGGTVQTPGAAVTSATCGAASTCTGNSCYCDLTFASDPGLTHDEVTIADTAEGAIGGSAHPGGGSSNLGADTTVAYNLQDPARDWAAGARVDANSRDGGVPDSGAADAGPDGGTSDGGVHPEVEGRSWTISWTNANCNDTGSGDGVDDSEGIMDLDEDGTFNDLECDFDAASLGFSSGGLYNHTTAFGLGTNGVTGGCLENTSSFPGVADEEPFVSRVVFLETSAQSTNRYHNWYQIDGNNLLQVVHNAARVNTGIVRVGGTSITEAFTGGATLNAPHVLDVAHDPNGLWGPANTVYVCRDGVCESTSGADHGAIAGGSPFGFGGPFNCSAGIEDMHYTHAGLYIGATDAADWSPSQHVVGALRWQTGGWASTYSLDPTAGNLSTAVTSGALDVLDEFTVLIWANASTLYLPAVSRWGGGGASTEQWWVGMIEGNANNAATHFEIGLEQGGQGRVCDGTASGWQQIGFVYDGSTTSLDCYENGALSNNALNGTVPASLNDENQDLQLGTTAGDDVDSFSYFNCALTAAEMLRAYCATHGASGHANSASCATAGPGSSSVDETDFDTYVLDHPCFVEHCDFERNGGCFNGTTLTGGSAAYTTAQP